jgi:hypothetical protein
MYGGRKKFRNLYVDKNNIFFAKKYSAIQIALQIAV